MIDKQWVLLHASRLLDAQRGHTVHWCHDTFQGPSTPWRITEPLCVLLTGVSLGSRTGGCCTQCQCRIPAAVQFYTLLFSETTPLSLQLLRYCIGHFITGEVFFSLLSLPRFFPFSFHYGILCKVINFTYFLGF